MEESEKLNLFIEVTVRMREAEEQAMRDLGLNWNTLKELREEVIESIPSDGIMRGRFKVTVQEKMVFAYKPDLIKYPMGTKKSVQIHELQRPPKAELTPTF
jgi:hypothetical protein